jgi:protein involved in polysaccharide export with SLBB domain
VGGYFDIPRIFDRGAEGVVPCIARVSRDCLLAVAVSFAVSGCSSALRLSGLDEAQPIISAPSMSARMQVGDQIGVTVYGEASLSGNYPIDSSGFVSIPLAGKLKAAGLTAAELADILVKKLRNEYRKDPKVTVSLAEVRAGL